MALTYNDVTCWSTTFQLNKAMCTAEFEHHPLYSRPLFELRNLGASRPRRSPPRHINALFFLNAEDPPGVLACWLPSPAVAVSETKDAALVFPPRSQFAIFGSTRSERNTCGRGRPR